MASGSIPAGAAAAPVHSSAFRLRRFLNWFPLGLSYAFLYMGRYNLTVAKNALGTLMTEEDFGIIFSIGTLVYGFAFLANGPLTDKIGGKRAMIISIVGSAVMNCVMGFYVLDPATRSNDDLRFWFSALYAVNMYFQSFGAVAIVKVNSSWFHVRERGGFSGIFGTMISSGIFLAFTVNAWLLETAASLAGTTELAQAKVVFFVPSALLALIFFLEIFLLKDRPSQAGQEDFDTGDASSGDQQDVPLTTLMWRIVSNPIILTVGLIEFCTGIIRQGVMQWYPFYAKNALSLPSSHYMRNGSWGAWYLILLCFAVCAVFFVLARRATGSRKAWLYTSGGLVFLAPFMQGGWGGLIFVAGVIGGNVAGHFSDLFFQSRRAPAAGGLYGVLVVCTVLMAFAMGKTTTEVGDSSMTVTGQVRPGEKVEVAGKPAKVSADGRYRADAPLSAGQSQVEVAMLSASGERTVSLLPVETLVPGDKVLAVAGVAVSDWVQVRKAFAAIPPQECLLGSRWDAKKKVCSISPSDAVETAAPTTGLIPVLILRNGQQLALELKDWAVKQRAGEPRVPKMTPVATMPAWLLGAIVILMSLCVIGTHGLLSGTATMDFGGRKGAATAVGMIDGFVYLGTAVQSISLGFLTSKSWTYWPWFMLPFSVIGFLLCLRIWNAKPQPRAGTPPQTLPRQAGGSHAPAAAAKTGTHG